MNLVHARREGKPGETPGFFFYALAMEARPYQPADRDACLALFDENAPEHFGRNERPEFAAYLDGAPAPFRIIEEAGRVLACGGIQLFPEQGNAEFRWVMAARAAQGRGCGRRLMLLGARDALEADIREILAYTTPGSAGFFRALGLPAETLRREPDYWTRGLDLELLRLELDAGAAAAIQAGLARHGER